MESGDTTSYIAAPYSAENLAGKAECKRDLLKQFGLAEDTQLPVVGMISRFVAQKGFDLVQQVADRLARADLILIMLGTGEPRIRRDVPATRTNSIRRSSPSRSPTTTRWRTRSKPAATCS